MSFHISFHSDKGYFSPLPPHITKETSHLEKPNDLDLFLSKALNSPGHENVFFKDYLKKLNHDYSNFPPPQIDFALRFAAISPKAAEIVASNLQSLNLTEDREQNKELANVIICSGEWAAQALAKNIHHLSLSINDQLSLSQCLVSKSAAVAKSLIENIHNLEFYSLPQYYQITFFLLEEASKYGNYASLAVIKQASFLKLEDMFSIVFTIIDQNNDMCHDAILKDLGEPLQILDDLSCLLGLSRDCDNLSLKLFLNNLSKIKHNDGSNTPFWKALNLQFKDPKQSIIKLFLCSTYENYSTIPEPLIEKLSQISYSSPTQHISLVRTLQYLMEKVSPETLENILKTLLDKDQDSFISNLVACGMLVSLEGEESLEECLEMPENNFKSYLNNLLLSDLPVLNDSVNFEKFMLFFGGSRQPFALTQYLSSLKKIESTFDLNRLLSSLNKFIAEVISNVYNTTIYNDSPHLQQTFFTSSSTNSPHELQIKWKESFSIPLKNLMSRFPSSPIPLDIHQFIREKISHGHLPQKFVPSVMGGLSDSENSATTPESTEHMALKSLVKLLCDTDISNYLKSVAITQYLNNHPKIGGFKEDLSSLKNHLSNHRIQDYSQYKALITHDPIDMLLSGTEVDASCQHVLYDPDYNKCLLNPMLDGKIQAVVIKDPYGTIVARAFVRLLKHSSNQNNVLFLEPTYTSDTNLKRCIEELAIEFAKHLELPLYTAKKGYEVRTSDFALLSLGSRAPFEYADSAPEEDYINNGFFSITQSRILLNNSFDVPTAM